MKDGQAKRSTSWPALLGPGATIGAATVVALVGGLEKLFGADTVANLSLVTAACLGFGGLAGASYVFFAQIKRMRE
jgi:hypothetical protein